MYKKTITYPNFDGEEITEDLFFNLSKSELTKSNYSLAGGIEALLRKMVNEKNVQTISELFTEFIGRSYGVKSEDGKFFRKSPEIRADFENSAAYDALYMELLSSPDEAIAFLKGVLPSELTDGIENNEEYKALIAKAKEAVQA